MIRTEYKEEKDSAIPGRKENEDASRRKTRPLRGQDRAHPPPQIRHSQSYKMQLSSCKESLREKKPRLLRRCLPRLFAAATPVKFRRGSFSLRSKEAAYADSALCLVCRGFANAQPSAPQSLRGPSASLRAHSLTLVRGGCVLLEYPCPRGKPRVELRPLRRPRPSAASPHDYRRLRPASPTSDEESPPPAAWTAVDGEVSLRRSRLSRWCCSRFVPGITYVYQC